MVLNNLSEKILESNNLLLFIVVVVVAIAAVEKERKSCAGAGCDNKQRNIRYSLIGLDIALLLAILPIAGGVINVLTSKKGGYKQVKGSGYVLLAVVLGAAALYITHLVQVAGEL